MIESLVLENYRRFANYRLDGLKRVNLLVGKNNAGKTSILEAIEILASAGDPRVLERIGVRRGELISDPDPRKTSTYLHTDVGQIFRGHSKKPGSKFKVSDVGRFGEVSVEVKDYDMLIGENDAVRELTAGLTFDENLLCVTYKPRDPTGGTPKPKIYTWPLYKTYLIPATTTTTPSPAPSGDRTPAPFMFVTQGSLDRNELADIWNRVQVEGSEGKVVEAMKTIDDEIETLVFLISISKGAEQTPYGIVLGRQGERRREPLGSFGEGIRRMLGLALAMVKAGGGTLLVDEIDTGLHYSVMGDLWRLICQTARDQDIQVFATTHSLDCIRGLDWLCQNHPDLGAEVSLQKIEPALSFAVGFDAREIMIANNHDVEVR